MANGHKSPRLYHFTKRTIQQIDVLAALYGGKEAAVAGAIDATYSAVAVALKKVKVKVPRKKGASA